MAYVRIGDLKVHKALKQVVEQEIAPGTGVGVKQIWSTLEKVLKSYAPENEALLRQRDALQAQIDTYCLKNAGKPVDMGEYSAFLGNIGYIVPEGAPFKINTTNVDPELKKAGPQLVVPVDNARYALNAANARWGSLLDAFYGTDAGPAETTGLEKGKSYNPARGAKVFEQVHSYVLDSHFPLSGGAKYDDVTEFRLEGANLVCAVGSKSVPLQNPGQFVGYKKNGSSLSSVLLNKNQLHVEIQIDRNSNVGKAHKAGVKDIYMESAITAICDMEDSVAAVDAEDKARVYKNWAGLMKGTLSEKFNKGGETRTRELAQDKSFTGVDGQPYNIAGRAVLLNRNVGLHLNTDAVLFADTDREVPESLVDAVVSVLAAIHDLKKPSTEKKNSRTGSVYIVRPKLHGPTEAGFVNRLFTTIEQELGLPLYTVKLGLMDEERRTSVNLQESIRAMQNRCVFINTGFLDRTGDEIHTSYNWGPMQTKAAIKQATWRKTYEDLNVDIGLAVGLKGKGQIGKGMWAMPDMMKDMLKAKIGEPKAGATVAWVPSPTGATLHALHYLMVDVLSVQDALEYQGRRGKLTDLLTPPLLTEKLSAEKVQHELEDTLQTVLGYVARWVQLGVGCSKVPDLSDVGLMEDRATLRISSQLLGNWLEFGLISREQLLEAAKKMAQIVDRQNQGQAGYEPMAPKYNDNGFNCAIQMILQAKVCPNGLTEGTLQKFRRAEKARRSMSKL